MYYAVNQSLSREYKLFWDEVIGTYDSFEISIPYLKKENYDILKEKLKDTEINYHVGIYFICF